MAYLLDLIAIFFIVILSYVLCMNNEKLKNSNSSCLMSHIVVGLSVIVFYKLTRKFKLNNNKETFFGDSVSASINQFVTNDNNIISPEQASKLSSDELNTYNQKIQTLTNQIKDFQLTTNQNNSNSVNLPNSNSYDLQSHQAYQNFQIDYLRNQIKNAQDNLNAQTIAESTKNYKPIKVFSSCIVSHANGSTTTDKPVSNSENSKLPFENIDLPTIEKMFSTISQSNSQTSGPVLSQQTGMFQDLLSKLPQVSNIIV